MTIRRRDMLAAALAGGVVLPTIRAASAQGTAPGDGTTGRQAATSRSAGELELFLLTDAPSTPTGIAVSAEGRVFVFMPRFTADVPYTVGEVAKDGSVTPYPTLEMNRPDPEKPQATFFHVPNGVFGRDGRSLWLLDAALPDGSGPPVKGGAKLVEIDLASNTVRRVVPLDAGTTGTSSLNDLRVGVTNGRDVAFVTDQGQEGGGRSWRSTSAPAASSGGSPATPARSRKVAS